MDNIRLPKKISPDRISDAIIELRYEAELPFEIGLGLLYESLDRSYIYHGSISRRVKAEQENIEFHIPQAQAYIFTHNGLTITVHPHAIIFNILKGHEYQGWDHHIAEITNVIDKLQGLKVVNHFTRVGARYVSTYPDMKLGDFTQLKFSFGLTEVESDKLEFKSQFNHTDHRINLNLIQVSGDSKKDLPLRSTIDIDVINEGLVIPVDEQEQILKIINTNHEVQKLVFFRLLHEDFLTSLNPEY